MPLVIGTPGIVPLPPQKVIVPHPCWMHYEAYRMCPDFDSCNLLRFLKSTIVDAWWLRGSGSALKVKSRNHVTAYFWPPYVCTKKSSKFCKKKYEVAKHNLNFLLYKFQKKSMVNIFKLIFEAKNNAF